MRSAKPRKLGRPQGTILGALEEQIARRHRTQPGPQGGRGPGYDPTQPAFFHVSEIAERYYGGPVAPLQRSHIGRKLSLMPEVVKAPNGNVPRYTTVQEILRARTYRHHQENQKALEIAPWPELVTRAGEALCRALERLNELEPRELAQIFRTMEDIT